MRIIHVLDHSLPLHSGYSFRTASILREQHALGWQTLQLTTPRHGPTDRDVEEAEGWLFHRTPLHGSSASRSTLAGYMREMVATTRRLDTLVREFRPDILHAHSPVLNVLPALRMGRRYGIPVVYEVRAFWEDAAVDHGSTQEGSLRYRVTRAVESFALKRAEAVTTICEGLRQDIVGRRIPASKVTVIPNAVDTNQFHVGGSADPALAESLGLRDKVVVGFLGSFYAYEGLDLLIKAATLLAPSIPDLRVLLVGGGPQDAALRQMAAQQGISDRIVFTGRVPHDQVQRHYDLIDVLVYPRQRMRLTDIVTPLKPLEAMAQGRIFLASDVGGHRELIRDGDTGMLFPAGDSAALAAALHGLLSRRDQWPDYRTRARRFVETERTWTRSVANYRGVYEPLLQTRGT